MSKHYFFALLFLLLTVLKSNAQKQFVSGYIINDKDTLKGFIHLREGSQTHQFCDFKTQIDAEEKRFTPETIDGYGYDNDRNYISASIEKEGINQRVFLEVYIKGTISMYRLDGGFILQKGSSFYPLKNSEELIIVDGEQYLQEKKEYLGILSFLTNDCRGYKRPIPLKKLSYSLESIGRYITEYNKCSGLQEESILTKKPLFSVGVGLTLSINGQNFFIGSEFKNLTGDRLRANANLGIGLPFYLYSPRISNSYAFYIEPQLSKTSIQHHNQTAIDGNRNDFFVNINYDYLKIPLGVKYRYLGRAVIPNFGIGLVTNLVLNENQKWSRDIHYTSNGIIESQDLIPYPLHKRIFGGWGSLGAESKIGKRISIFGEFRLEYGNGLLDKSFILADDEVQNTIGYQLIIGIKTR